MLQGGRRATNQAVAPLCSLSAPFPLCVKTFSWAQAAQAPDKRSPSLLHLQQGPVLEQIDLENYGFRLRTSNLN